MKKLLICLSVVFISACTCNPEKPSEPTTTHELITKKIPSELLVIPSAPQSPNLDGTQKDISLWLLENEKRVKQLENQIDKIRQYNEGK